MWPTYNPGEPMNPDVSKYNEGQIQAIGLYVYPILDELVIVSQRGSFDMEEFLQAYEVYSWVGDDIWAYASVYQSVLDLIKDGN